jgi:DNA-binding GntR family transcriptional regulator
MKMADLSLARIGAEMAEDDGPAPETALNARAYAILRERLLSGAYTPGALLNTRPLAAEFGMSPMPVREALARLRSDGALEALPNRAFRVPVLSESAFRELLIMRLRLEACACERAAILASIGDARAVTEAYDDMVKASSGSLEIYLAAHRRFHFIIYELADMPLLKTFIEGLWLRMGPLLHASSQGRIQIDHVHHGAMVKALATADPVGLVAALRDDLTDGLEPIVDYLRAHSG